MVTALLNALDLHNNAVLRGLRKIDTSSCDAKGQDGCQLWLDLDAVWARRREQVLTLKHAQVHVVVQQHRVLIVRVTVRNFALAIVVAHAPHSGRPVAEVVLFWRTLVVSVRNAVKKDDRVLFLGDTNAHVHSRKLDEMAHAAYFMEAMRDLGMHVAP